jgi:putative spermidine/putrescine transport system permease protein
MWRPRGLAIPYLLSLPALAFIALMFLLPVLSLVATSFTSASPHGGAVVTLSHYTAALSDPFVRTMILRTLRVSFVTTFVTLVAAFPVALHLRRASARARSILIFILISPLLTSVVVRTLGWVILLGPRGPVNLALASLGLNPVQLIYNETGIIIGLVHVFFGYMVLCLMTSVLRIDESLVMAAANLGAGRWSILIRILIPLSIPGAVAGSVLVFSMSASTYATPVLLGGNRVKVLAAQIYDLAITFLDWPGAAALATILFVMVTFVVWGTLRLAGEGRA